MHKNAIRYRIEYGLRYVTKKVNNSTSFANGVDLIDRKKKLD